MCHFDEFLGLRPTLQGRREVLFSFANIICQLLWSGPLSPELLDSDWSPPLIMGLGNAARVYAREVGHRMMLVAGVGESTTLTPKFVGFINRHVKSVCDLLSYESSSESSSKPASCGGRSGYNQLRKCFTMIIPEDQPEGSRPQIAGNAGTTPTTGGHWRDPHTGTDPSSPTRDQRGQEGPRGRVCNARRGTAGVRSRRTGVAPQINNDVAGLPQFECASQCITATTVLA